MQPFPTILGGIQDLEPGHIKHLLLRTQYFQSHFFNPLSLPDSKEDFSKFNICTFFQEDSTRTKISFMRAAHNLGIQHIPFDTHTSSLKKGESLDETLDTLKYLGINLVIYRTSVNNEIDKYRADPPLAMINAGDGTNQHPTQALTDLYTFIDCEKDLRGKTLAIIGDCKHSRVCNSLVELSLKVGLKINLVIPQGLECPQHWSSQVKILHDVDEAILQSDLLYLLRIQKERHRNTEDRKIFENYSENFGVNKQRLDRLNKYPPIYHAGPAISGQEIDEWCLKSDLFRANLQVKNGVFVRMALVETMLKNLNYNSIHDWNYGHEKNLYESLLVL